MENVISSFGAQFIQSWEVLKLTKYDDGYGFMTIGWGHLIKPGEDYNKITINEANNIFMNDVSKFESIINKNVKVELEQNEFDALVSFVFNVGGTNFKNSTLLKKLNNGDKNGAAEQLLQWTKSAGKQSKGLKKRREQEKDIFLNNHYTFTH